MLKRNRAVFAVILAIVLLAICLSACNAKTQSGEKQVLVYVGESEFVVKTERLYLHELLCDLKEEGKLARYEFSSGAYGVFLTGIGDIEQDFENGKYYSIWHAIDDDDLKAASSEYDPSRAIGLAEGLGADKAVWTATIYKQRMLYYSGVGVGEIPLVNGGVYAILLD